MLHPFTNSCNIINTSRKLPKETISNDDIDKKERTVKMGFDNYLELDMSQLRRRKIWDHGEVKINPFYAHINSPTSLLYRLSKLSILLLNTIKFE